MLKRAPLRYGSVGRGSPGSHTRLTSTAGYPDLIFSFHDGQTLSPGLVRKILVKDVGLSEEEALTLL